MGQVQLFEGNGHAGLTSQSACPYKGSCLEKVKVEAGLGTTNMLAGSTVVEPGRPTFRYDQSFSQRSGKERHCCAPTAPSEKGRRGCTVAAIRVHEPYECWKVASQEGAAVAKRALITNGSTALSS
jgi:hypothetical protein